MGHRQYDLEHCVSLPAISVHYYLLSKGVISVQIMMKIQVLVLAKVILAANFSNNFNALVSNSEYNLAPAEGRTTSDHCGFQLYDLVPGDKGWISTPNYPQGYPPNLKCIWWLKVTINK